MFVTLQSLDICALMSFTWKLSWTHIINLSDIPLNAILNIKSLPFISTLLAVGPLFSANLFLWSIMNPLMGRASVRIPWTWIPSDIPPSLPWESSSCKCSAMRRESNYLHRLCSSSYSRHCTCVVFQETSKPAAHQCRTQYHFSRSCFIGLHIIFLLSATRSIKQYIAYLLFNSDILLHAKFIIVIRSLFFHSLIIQILH